MTLAQLHTLLSIAVYLYPLIKTAIAETLPRLSSFNRQVFFIDTKVLFRVVYTPILCNVKHIQERHGTYTFVHLTGYQIHANYKKKTDVGSAHIHSHMDSRDGMCVCVRWMYLCESAIIHRLMHT